MFFFLLLLPYCFLGFDERLNSLKERLELIHTALKSYLETKRHIFPRFYFMSNSDILEVLGQSKRPENVQSHLKKCFDNINKIKVVKVGRISSYSIYWRQSLNINKDKGIWHKVFYIPMSLLHGFLLQILKIFTYKK